MRTRRCYALVSTVALLLVASGCGDEIGTEEERELFRRSRGPRGRGARALLWPDEGARDRALRQFEVQMRPSSRSHGATWELGLLTVHVEGERDDAVVDRVADAMKRLGAS